MATINRTNHKTKKASVEEYPGGVRKYGPYPKKNKAGKPTNRQITVIRKADGSTTSEHTAKKNENDQRRKEGKKPIPKQAPGKGTQVAHNKGTNRSDSRASSVKAQSAKKNIGDGNKARAKK